MDPEKDFVAPSDTLVAAFEHFPKLKDVLRLKLAQYLSRPYVMYGMHTQC